jgi:CDP-glucose 4,6-dehydratase|tara:strand:+ start:1118 stop:2185 length:1068 start_codon:yes stop_codon:yes gene_type:complete
MENMEINYNFWRGRSVFLTGHTGFKGGWLALWLTEMGAKVYGYSLDATTSPNFFKIVNLKDKIENSTVGDIRNLSDLVKSIKEAKPSIIFHMAAQSLVRKSYDDPIDTYTTNVIGTVNVLEAVRKVDTVQAIVNITTDKCYENQEWSWPYRESDRLGGYDPYSSSKACSELATAAYRNSFLKRTEIKVATARAGNVIGGGDWAADRLLPDFFRSINNNEVLNVRSPHAVRPWQHVLDPLSGYLKLAEKLITNGNNFAESWNFGPDESGAKTVMWILNRISKKFANAKWIIEKQEEKHEATLLKLDISKAKSKLGWTPKWNVENAIDNTVEWHIAFQENEKISDFSIKQIKLYQNL